MFSRGKLEWFGYRTLKKLWRYVKPFQHNTRTWQTGWRTDRTAISISRVSIVVLTRDKKNNTCKFTSVIQICSGAVAVPSFVFFSTKIWTSTPPRSPWNRLENLRDWLTFGRANPELSRQQSVASTSAMLDLSCQLHELTSPTPKITPQRKF